MLRMSCEEVGETDGGQGSRKVWFVPYLFSLPPPVSPRQCEFELVAIIDIDATFLYRVFGFIGTIIMIAIHRRRVEGEGLPQQLIAAPSSDGERGNNDYYDQTRQTREGKDHTRQSLVLKERLVSRRDTLSGRG
jgi:hypothetical protein